MNEIISGRNSVREAVRAGKRTINKIYIARTAHGEAVQDIIQEAKARNIPVHHVPPERLDAFKALHNQGVIAEVSPTEYLDLDGLMARVGKRERLLLVILDGIEDPHNLGSIIRSSVALGADGIVIGKWRSAALTDTVTKTSAGASEHIPIARVTNIAECVSSLKERGVWVYGTHQEGKALRAEKFSFPMALVIGSEGKGLHDLVKKRCDFLLSIPQTDAISSLNAACAAAVFLYEIFLQKSA